jgi:hypothetical protein
MTEDSPVPLSDDEKKLWIHVLEREIAQNSTEPSGAVRTSAWRKFQSQRWLFLKGVSFEESLPYANYGPDLTAIPRTRFAGTSTSQKSQTKKSKRPTSGYNRYVKDTIAQKNEEWADVPQPEKIRRIGAQWRALSNEEKQAFTENQTDS